MSRQRFASLLEAYCTYCGGAILDKIIQDVKVLNRNIGIAVAVKESTSYVRVFNVFGVIYPLYMYACLDL